MNKAFSRYRFTLHLGVLILLFVNQRLSAQDKEQIYIRNADLAKAETKTTPPQTSYIGNVMAYHKGAYIFCDNAVLKENTLYANGKVSISQNDTIEVYADTLIYSGNENLAYLIGEVILINGDDTLYTQELEYDTELKIARYSLRAYMKAGKNTLKSQIGSYDTKIKEAWFYEKVSIESDSTYITTDSLRYNTASEESYWKSPGIVKSGKSQLYSEQGLFNSKTQNGFFTGNAQYKEDTVTATADTIILDKGNDIFHLKGNAIYYSNSDSATANSIYFNKKIDSIALEGTAYYKGIENKVNGDTINYNKSSGGISVSGQSTIEDNSTRLEGLNVKYDKKTKSGSATGNVIYSDTIENVKLWTDTLIFNNETKYIYARSAPGRMPVYATDQDGDSLYITGEIFNSYTTVSHKTNSNVIDSASYAAKKRIFSMNIDSLELHQLDTTVFKNYIVTRLLKEKKIEPQEYLDTLSGKTIVIIDTISALQFIEKANKPDTTQFLVVNKNVLVYKSDMQMKADSLFFNGTDSLFTLYKDPVIWSDSTQMSADTINIYLKNNKVNSLDLLKNGYIVTTEDFKFYNQIKGRKIKGLFEKGKISSIKVDGNAQLIYYLKDEKDKSYMGVNTTDASSFSFVFNDGKIKEIRHFGNPQSKILPMKGTDHQGIRLEGFNARFESRPTSVRDIFNPMKQENKYSPPSVKNQAFEIDKENEKFIKKQ